MILLMELAEDDYPKSYADIRRGAFRLDKWQERNDIQEVESKLWRIVLGKAKDGQARKTFKDYQFIGAGWEWSVFLTDNKVVKVPAGIFSEVNDPRYLENTEFAYRKILDYFPQKHVTKSNFKRVDGLNMIEQEYIKGEEEEVISLESKNKDRLEEIRLFLKPAWEMLEDCNWLPDFDIKRVKGGFQLRSVIYKKDSPKIVDFTAYYDVYRLYKERTKQEVKNKRERIVEFEEWIEKKLREI